MTQIASNNPGNYTIGGMRLFWADKLGTAGTPVAVNALDAGTSTITLTGDVTTEYVTGVWFTISGSTDMDGDYRVVSSSLVTTNTEVVVAQTFVSTTADGNASTTHTAELNFGNVVTGALNSDITPLDHYSAKTGTRKKDRRVIQEVAVNINITVDEPTAELVKYWTLAGDITEIAGSPTIKKFSPFTNFEQEGRPRFQGVSDTGNEFEWTPWNAQIAPDGDFTYNAEDWSEFSFSLEILDDTTSHPTTPYGEWFHYGVGTQLN